jgi:hypothetical protein
MQIIYVSHLICIECYRFIAVFSSGSILEDFVSFPKSEEDWNKLMETYRVLGFPGCIGSADCTQIALGRPRKTKESQEFGNQ